MRIVQTFWTGNNELLEYSFGWLHPEYNLMSWALSCLCLRTHYKDVVLYTDSKGYHILIDVLKLPYSEVHVVYDNFKCLSHHWALAKLMTYYSQKEKFLHIDGDIYLVKPLPKRILNASLIAQNREIGSRYYQSMIDNILKQKTISVPAFIKESIEDTSLCSYNTGFFGGADIGFIHKYCEQAFSFMESNNMNNPKIKHSATDCNVFFEQVFFASMTKREKRKVTCILNREMLDQGYSTADFCNLTQFDHKQFFHILGGHKQNIEICKQLAQILLSKHPAYCLKILSLFPSKNVRFLIEKENKSILGVEKSLAQYEDFLLKQKKEWAGILFDKLYNLEKAITCYSHFADMRQSERRKCFFVVMEYMGSKYGLKDRSYNDYFNEFQNDSTNMNNAYLEEDTVKIGPADYLPIKSEDGKTTESQPNPYTYKYIDKYFETRDNGWQEGEDKLRNYYEEKPVSRKGNKVFGVIKIEDNGEEKAHAVVITGVQGNYVDYNGPARGESNQSIGFDKFEYFSVIKGLKKDENE